MVIIACLTKWATYPPCRQDIMFQALPHMFFKYMLCTCDWLGIITSNCVTELTSWFWDRVRSQLNIAHRLMSWFHLQIDDQTELSNQRSKQYFWVYCNKKLDSSIELLLLAKLVYNYPVHSTMRMISVLENHNFHLMMQFKLPKASSFILQVPPVLWMVGMEETHWILQEYLLQAQPARSGYAGCTKTNCAVGHTVCLLTRNLWISRPSMKLGYQGTKAYMVSKTIYEHAYQLDFCSTIWNHNLFHITSQSVYIVWCVPTLTTTACDISQWTKEIEVDYIPDSRHQFLILYYLTKLATYNGVHRSWETVEHLQTAQDMDD